MPGRMTRTGSGSGVAVGGMGVGDAASVSVIVWMGVGRTAVTVAVGLTRVGSMAMAPETSIRGVLTPWLGAGSAVGTGAT